MLFLARLEYDSLTAIASGVVFRSTNCWHSSPVIFP
uniref:Uncharacterized protein n=1 Tax=Arundo donax TaxID=35708 RepID=A0A0A9B4D0_ARUDO